MRTVSLLVAVLLLAGCSKKEETTRAAETAPANARESITDLTNVLGIPLTRIGQVKRGKGVSLMNDGKPVKIDGRGFDHFSNP